MNKLLFILLILTMADICRAQQCRHKGLSKKYDYRITAVKTTNADGETRISKILVRVIRKASKKQFQQLTVTPEYLFQKAFTDCSAARSYVTGKNARADSTDNDYGDFIVADFNFDGREDFAVKRDSGGNGGAFYRYYIQDKAGAFRKDSFLTDVVGYFPGTIDRRKKRLVTYIHANAQGYNENVYQYRPAAKKWKFLSQTYHLAGQ